MSKLGFLFKLQDSDKKYLIFVENNNLKKDLIIGNSILEESEKPIVFYLSKELQLETYHIINLSSIRRAKFHLSADTILDYEFNTFWFNPTKYRELRQLFELESFSEKIIISKVIEIMNYFL